MAAPQQHPLTNTSCTFSSSPAAFPPTAGSYGSGKTAFCGDLQGQVSVASDRNVQSLVCSSTTVSPQPILTNSASRKTKPCSLCGTAALRSQSSLVPNSPVSPQEQPVVLLHRLEDGLPEGDVDSLRAFGTIRLLPVHCALSIDSPPISPAACEISDSQVPFSETLGGDSRTEETDSAARLDTVFKSKADPEVIETRDSKAVPQYHLTRTSSMENDEVSNKSHSGQKEVAQVPSASETGPAPSAQIHMPEDTSTASQNSEIEAHADTYQESSTDHECGDRENSLKEVEHLKPDFVKSSLNSEKEAPSVPDERNLAPTLSPGESPSHCAKYEESAETADSPSPTEQSLSHSLPSDASEVNTDVGDRTKSLIEDSEEITETQTECTESNTHETSNLTVEVPKTRDDEPAFMELQQEGKETSQASSGTLHSSEIDHQNKQPEGLILRSRRSRHAKNTESGRNSDTCLWVSFGVNAPMPLPATDLPSLEPLFTSKEKTKLKESETNGSKEHASSNQPKVEVKKHPPKATHKERKEREKTETQPDATKESTEHEYESKAKFLTEHSDSKTVVSHGHRKVHSSSSHEDSNGAHCKVRSHGDSTHHRSRHSHKRQRKSDDDREGAIMKETDSLPAQLTRCYRER
ncbi:hypothetical protein O3P69_020384 [Scylla paramamosain]|uniref:Uncharacterized protein n=1 Tax=Scylla paramamosain TaxID=85552 RepID=A0AAW0TLJ7_SCYPA